ncbi:hypothetical protein [Salinispirillum sp. LH 10-3-1]|uniref:hypothetical protein n=1 Tax=Salinispirillum sp. LH 10-3-1 TaxID=2952525 RepID=UPI00351AFE5F
MINDRVDGEPITGVMVQMWVKRQQQAPADWILEISEALNKEVSVFDLLRDRKRRKLPSSRSAA